MKIIYIVRVLIISIHSFGQLPKDYSNEIVQKEQRGTVDNIITLLENNDTEKVKNYFICTGVNLDSILSFSVMEISKFKNITTLSIMIVYDEGHNIYRCRYYNKNNEMFQIDLHFKEEEPNSIL